VCRFQTVSEKIKVPLSAADSPEIWESLLAGANMGIGPIITNLIPLPLTRPIEPEIETAPMQRVENSARTGDETYSPSDGRSASGSDDDSTEEEMNQADESGDSTAASSDPTNQQRPISFFA
jgi:hypothetical protein